MQPRRRTRTIVLVLALALHAPWARAADAVTEWTLEADRLGRGGANWRTLAIMHRAMHDAANAVRPRYARWAPPAPDEPPAEGASLEAALAAAAAQVLVDLHPDAQTEIGTLYQNALRLLPPGPDVRAGIALGQAIGNAAVTMRVADGFERTHAFAGGDGPGRWQPVPPRATSNTTAAIPFLFATREWDGATPPPAPGSDEALQDLAETRRVGGAQTVARSEAQTYAATFWAYQSSQRGFIRLAVSLLDETPLPGGLHDHARLMAQLATAMADSAIMTWSEKERFSYWRPAAAIAAGGFGAAPDPGWAPLIETPPHPEYPSGHAADCFTGAAVLTAAFGAIPITYVAQSGMPQAEVAAIGMGQHEQAGQLAPVARPFPSPDAAAQECALSRIWSGAHFRAADTEAARLAHEIAARALQAVPPTQ